MTEETHPLIMLRPMELRAVYEINLAIMQSADVDAALDQIIHLTRNVLIFDNMVLYLRTEAAALEPAYARVIGRGKTAEADLAWGEEAATDAFQRRKTVVRTEKLPGWEQDRLCWRTFVGLPLQQWGENAGALVFGRFGGPPFEAEQIRLVEFIAVQVYQMLEHHLLRQKVAALEAERRLHMLQDEFIALVSHELRTPLGFIKGYATTLLRQDTTWDEQSRREFLTIIDEESDHLRELIDDLLDTSRLQSGSLYFQFQAVNLAQLLQEVIARASARYTDLQIQLLGPTDIQLEVDSVRLAQVFDNLLSNAVKYAPGSPVYIEVVPQSQRCQIMVRDQGPGISADHLVHLFERFFRVPDVSMRIHGTGLGLYICRLIIEAHGGKIWATSEPADGTTLWISLPWDGKLVNLEQEEA